MRLLGRLLSIVTCLHAVACFSQSPVHEHSRQGFSGGRWTQHQRWKYLGARQGISMRHRMRGVASTEIRLLAAKELKDKWAVAFSRFVPVKTVPHKRLLGARLAATEAECKAIAKRASLFAVNMFHANVTMTRVVGPTVKVAGNITASIVWDEGDESQPLNTAFVVDTLDNTMGEDVDMLSMDNPYMFESDKEGKLNIGDICYSFFVLNLDNAS